MIKSKKFLTAIVFLFILNISMISAWPYQLNLSDGALTDLNVSNNLTTNLTIYIVSYNYTIQDNDWINITNLTCLNCTYYNNYTYAYTYILNATNYTFYNKTDSDAKFLTVVDFNSYKTSLTYSTITELNNAITSLNQTINNIETTNIGIGILWILIIISILLGIAGIFLAYKAAGVNAR